MTPEQATEHLAAAITDMAVADGLCDPSDELLDSFVVVAHWQAIDVVGDTSRYTVFRRPLSNPVHATVGLLTVALDAVAEGRVGEDD